MEDALVLAQSKSIQLKIYFSASLISMSRCRTSVRSSDSSTPRWAALAEKYSQTPRSIAAGIRTFASAKALPPERI
jgi:hypothetical protein